MSAPACATTRVHQMGMNGGPCLLCRRVPPGDLREVVHQINAPPHRPPMRLGAYGDPERRQLATGDDE